MQEAQKGTGESASLIIAGKIPLRVPSPAPQASPAGAGKTPAPRTPSPTHASSQLQAFDSIEARILAYYYAALTNLFCQAHLSSLENVEEDDAVKAAVDRSYEDFCALGSWLDVVNPNELQPTASWPLFLEARDNWKNLVKNWSMLAKTGQNKPVETSIDAPQI